MSTQQQPIGWISAHTAEMLKAGKCREGYAPVARIYAGIERPRKRDSANWVPLYLSTEPVTKEKQ